MPIRLVLADSHPLMLRGLEGLLTTEAGFEIVALCANGDDALEAVHAYLPGILVLDIRLPGKDGLAVLREIHKHSLPVSGVLYTAEVNEKQAIDSIRCGVRGIVLKEMAPELLVQCLLKVSRGSRWIETHSFSRAIEVLLRREEGLQAIQRGLTHRQHEIVRMVAGGLRNREIAEKLFISEGTVKLHLHNIYRKLNLRDRVDLLRHAQGIGLVAFS